MLRLRSPTVAFMLLGLVAGVFATLFGVGGGIVVIPVLVGLLAFAPREAAGTSLAAIGLTAAFGVAVYASLGRVHWAEAAVVGAPALVGVLAGSSLQRRLSSRALLLAFSALLVVVAILMLVR